MGIDRLTIEKAFEGMRADVDAGDWDAWVNRFAEDGTFVNSLLEEPIRGREALRAFAAHWPRVTNRPEWVVIDGERLVVGWNERQESMADDAPPYRGISTFVFDADGLVKQYEGMFDPAAIAAAVGARSNGA